MLPEGQGSGPRRGQKPRRGLTPEEAGCGPAFFQQSNVLSLARLVTLFTALMRHDDVADTQPCPDFGHVEPWPDKGPPLSGPACMSGPPVREVDPRGVRAHFLILPFSGSDFCPNGHILASI